MVHLSHGGQPDRRNAKGVMAALPVPDWNVRAGELGGQGGLMSDQGELDLSTRDRLAAAIEERRHAPMVT